MSEEPVSTGQGRFGLSPEEYSNLKTMLRMGATIVLTVGATLVVVALVAGALGFQG